MKPSTRVPGQKMRTFYEEGPQDSTKELYTSQGKDDEKWMMGVAPRMWTPVRMADFLPKISVNI